MGWLSSLLNRFLADQRGAFAAIFGVLALVLIAVSGAVVDYTAEEQARTRAQVALDAAALALQPRIYDANYNSTSIKAAAQALLTNRIGDTRITATVTGITINTTDGELTLKAHISVPTYFVALVGVNTLSANLQSQATRKKLNLEVAMVLDNSGSMEDSRNGYAMRMSRLKTAANKAVDIIFGGAATQPNVAMAIIPFNNFVNVGSSNSTQDWIDKSGTSAIANDNFDSDDNDGNTYTGAVNRLALYSAIGVNWAGCVEARTSPYDTNDTTPTTATPDTLFVPEFAPDEPYGWNNSYLSDSPSACDYTGANAGTCTYVETTGSCNSSGSSCSGWTSSSSSLAAGPKGNAGSLSCSCSTGGSYSQNVSGNRWSGYTRTRTWTCSYSYAAQDLSDREKQERLCKYTGSASFSSGKGPNYDCPSTSILPLTNVSATVKSRITAMSASGNTNIAQGAVWGFHALSPTEPFTQGKAYDTGGNSKVMIIMTDGDNTSGYADYYGYWGNMNGTSLPSAYMYRWNGRLPGNSDAEQVTEMNTRTLATCTNAKAKGITIYTVGLSSTEATSIAMLKACATDLGKAYFPAQSSGLDAVFTEIANQLSLLRLSQ